MGGKKKNGRKFKPFDPNSIQDIKQPSADLSMNSNHSSSSTSSSTGKRNFKSTREAIGASADLTRSSDSIKANESGEYSQTPDSSINLTTNSDFTSGNDSNTVPDKRWESESVTNEIQNLSVNSYYNTQPRTQSRNSNYHGPTNFRGGDRGGNFKRNEMSNLRSETKCSTERNDRGSGSSYRGKRFYKDNTSNYQNQSNHWTSKYANRENTWKQEPNNLNTPEYGNSGPGLENANNTNKNLTESRANFDQQQSHWNPTSKDQGRGFARDSSGRDNRPKPRQNTSNFHKQTNDRRYSTPQQENFNESVQVNKSNDSGEWPLNEITTWEGNSEWDGEPQSKGNNKSEGNSDQTVGKEVNDDWETSENYGSSNQDTENRDQNTSNWSESSQGKQLNTSAEPFVPKLKTVHDKCEDNITSSNADPYFENTVQPAPDLKSNTALKEESNKKNYRKSLPETTYTHNAPKRYSEGSNFGNSKDNLSKGNSRGRPDKNSYDRRSASSDKEYMQFCVEEDKKATVQFLRVTEIQQDLFAMPKEYSLGHCVAEDMRMGSGIAVSFKREFKDIDVLLNQRQKQGGVAVLENETEAGTRYVYYLVTKRDSTGKPTYEKFWCSLKNMRDHIRDNNVQKLAIPRLGCGLDRLEWVRVKHMIEFLFRDVDVAITVCNFQQAEDSPEKPLNNTCKVVHVKKSIADIEVETTIIYLSTEDGHVSNEMEELSKKFSFLQEFKQARKQLGDVIKYDVPGKYYILYGCIVRKSNKDPFNFVSFHKCLSQINKNNKKDLYIYMGVQAVTDNSDDLFMEKIITMLKNYLHKVDIYVCWDGELAIMMPISHREQ